MHAYHLLEKLNVPHPTSYKIKRSPLTLLTRYPKKSDALLNVASSRYYKTIVLVHPEDINTLSEDQKKLINASNYWPTQESVWGVLAHEVAHIAHQHAEKSARFAIKQKMATSLIGGATTLAGLYYFSSTLKDYMQQPYKSVISVISALGAGLYAGFCTDRLGKMYYCYNLRNQEYEADATAIDMLLKDNKKNEAVAYMNNFKTHFEGYEKFYNNRSFIKKAFSSHPSPMNRYWHMKKNYDHHIQPKDYKVNLD